MVTIIDEPGSCYIVNDEPKPHLYRSWKVVEKRDIPMHDKLYGIFFTENDTINGSWTQKFMKCYFSTVEGAKEYLHKEILPHSVKKSELIRHGILPKEVEA